MTQFFKLKCWMNLKRLNEKMLYNVWKKRLTCYKLLYMFVYFLWFKLNAKIKITKHHKRLVYFYLTSNEILYIRFSHDLPFVSVHIYSTVRDVSRFHELRRLFYLMKIRIFKRLFFKTFRIFNRVVVWF